MTFVRWIMLFASVVVYRVWFPEPPPPMGLRFDYEMVVIALVALYRGVSIGTAVGWAIGFLSHATDPDMMGWGSLLGAALGWTVGALKERLFLEYILSRWLVLWGVLLTIKVLYIAFAVGLDPGLWISSLFPAGLGSTGLSATVGVVASIIWDRARARAHSIARLAATEERST